MLFPGSGVESGSKGMRVPTAKTSVLQIYVKGVVWGHLVLSPLYLPEIPKQHLGGLEVSS